MQNGIIFVTLLGKYLIVLCLLNFRDATWYILAFFVIVEGQEWCKPLRRFLPGEKYEQVALVSYPCSGNSWLRYLLQQATGIYTGSNFYDIESEAAGLLEGVTSRVLVVKQHTALKEPTNFTRAILLVRDPKDVIPSAYSLFFGGHVALAPESTFKGYEFDRFLRTHIDGWMQLHMETLTWLKGPILIVYYEILLKNTRKTLEKVLKFLNWKYNEADIDCAMSRMHSPLRRPSRNNDVFHPVTKKQQQYIATQISRVTRKLKKYPNIYNNTYSFKYKYNQKINFDKVPW